MNFVPALTRLLLSLLFIAAAAPAIAQSVEALLDQAIAGDHRSSANKARDQYRHPRETLLFFGLKPDMTVVEIWPAGGWYSEILAPVLRDKGRLYLAHVAIENPKLENWQRLSQNGLSSTVNRCSPRWERRSIWRSRRPAARIWC